ncbi:MAG: NAD-dependent epimerase/dehydratase family protein [Planctomycetota bacterium]|nr:NAD-dependent epimerase/dehydratase family protein [Planctomycetota bacterium]
MKILIIGGTLFIGRAIALKLFEDGHEVAVLNRGKTSPDLPGAIQLIKGDRDNLAASRADILGFAPEVVLHNIVIHKGHITDLQELVAGVVKRIVLTSSMDVYKSYGILTGIETGPVMTEIQGEDGPLRDELYPYRKDLPDSNHPLYNYDKIPAEQAVLEHSEIEGVVLRLPMVFGPRDWQYRLFDKVKPMIDGRGSIVESEEVAAWRTSYAYVENVAAAFALACVKAEAAGQVYNVSDGLFSTEDLCERVKAELNWTGHYLKRPAKELPETFHPGFETAQHLLFSDAKIRRELGYSPVVSMEDGIKRTVEWLRENHPEKMDEDLVHYKVQDEALRLIEQS